MIFSQGAKQLLFQKFFLDSAKIVSFLNLNPNKSHFVMTELHNISQDPFLSLKQAAAGAALDLILSTVPSGSVLGVGSGSTVECLIDLLGKKTKQIAHFSCAVASSNRTAEKLKAIGMRVVELNEVLEKGLKIPVYVDGADEINPRGHMIKGGGAALTREKIIASVAEQFICMVDPRKCVDVLGEFPLPVEIVPMAAQALIQKIKTWGGQAKLREGCVTDNHNWILDVSGLMFDEPLIWEARFNQLVGVVTNGLFAARAADYVLVAQKDKVVEFRVDPDRGTVKLT
jgi:ribose 5-phosphate isomerase A